MKCKRGCWEKKFETRKIRKVNIRKKKKREFWLFAPQPDMRERPGETLTHRGQEL